MSFDGRYPVGKKTFKNVVHTIRNKKQHGTAIERNDLCPVCCSPGTVFDSSIDTTDTTPM